MTAETTIPAASITFEQAMKRARSASGADVWSTAFSGVT